MYAPPTYVDNCRPIIKTIMGNSNADKNHWLFDSNNQQKYYNIHGCCHAARTLKI